MVAPSVGREEKVGEGVVCDFVEVAEGQDVADGRAVLVAGKDAGKVCEPLAQGEYDLDMDADAVAELKSEAEVERELIAELDCCAELVGGTAVPLTVPLAAAVLDRVISAEREKEGLPEGEGEPVPLRQDDGEPVGVTVLLPLRLCKGVPVEDPVVIGVRDAEPPDTEGEPEAAEEAESVEESREVRVKIGEAESEGVKAAVLVSLPETDTDPLAARELEPQLLALPLPVAGGERLLLGVKEGEREAEKDF